MQSEAIRGAAAYSTPTSPAFCHMASLMAGSWSMRVYANQSRPHRQSSPSPDEGCNQRQSEAIRGNQRQSEAIRCNQMQSDAIRARDLRSAHRRKAIRGTPRHSKAISGNQRAIREQSEALRGTPRHSKGHQWKVPSVISRHQPSSAVISRHQWKVPSVSAQAQSSRIRRGIQPQAHNCRIEASTRGAPVRPTHLPPGAIRGNQRQSEVISGNQWSPRTTDTPAIGRNQRQ